MANRSPAVECNGARGCAGRRAAAHCTHQGTWLAAYVLMQIGSEVWYGAETQQTGCRGSGRQAPQLRHAVCGDGHRLYHTALDPSESLYANCNNHLRHGCWHGHPVAGMQWFRLLQFMEGTPCSADAMERTPPIMAAAAAAPCLFWLTCAVQWYVLSPHNVPVRHKPRSAPPHARSTACSSPHRPWTDRALGCPATRGWCSNRAGAAVATAVAAAAAAQPPSKRRRTPSFLCSQATHPPCRMWIWAALTVTTLPPSTWARWRSRSWKPRQMCC